VNARRVPELVLLAAVTIGAAACGGTRVSVPDDPRKTLDPSVCAVDISFAPDASSDQITAFSARVAAIPQVSTLELLSREQVIDLVEGELRRVGASPEERASFLAKVRREAGAVLVATPDAEEDVSEIGDSLSLLPGEVTSVWPRDSCG
jgi:hypothetical protein